jgi:hypothetical protein
MTEGKELHISLEANFISRLKEITKLSDEIVEKIIRII